MANKPLNSIQFPNLSDTYTIPQVDTSLSVAGKAADAKATGDELSELKSILNGSSSTNYVEGKNIDATGALVDDSTKCVSEKIPYTWPGSTRFYTGLNSNQDCRIAYYDANDNLLNCFIAPGAGAEYRAINAETQVTGTVSYVRFSFLKNYAAQVVQNANPLPSPYWVATAESVAGLTERVSDLESDKLSIADMTYSTSAATLTTGTTLEIATNVDNRKHDTIDFRADITSFTNVTVGHGYQVNHGMWVTVDGTNITTYDDEDGGQVAQQAHGLTISDFIHVLVIRGDNSRATIEVITGGGIYRWENVVWAANRGSVFAFCTGTLTNAKLNAVFRDMNSLIFMFGDSYQSFGDQARYPYYLVQDGFTDFLAAGFPGANATHGIAAFRAIIAKAKPKYVVWALGMNGSDTSSAVNADWKTATDEVIATCDANNITVILATIPNVPDRIQTYKNAYVAATGKRYIDFAEAVGAESAGSTWYTGMLSSDNLHPTALGAQALYSQLLADFPEIMR